MTEFRSSNVCICGAPKGLHRIGGHEARCQDLGCPCLVFLPQTMADPKRLIILDALKSARWAILDARSASSTVAEMEDTLAVKLVDVAIAAVLSPER
jgi:hypothetical protein